MVNLSRKDFLKVLGAVSLSPLVHASPSVRLHARKIYLNIVPIAGFYYYDGERVFSELTVGDELELRRQPSNPYDENAIEVYTASSHKLGYVPRIENPIPAKLVDQDVAIGAEIFTINASPDTYPPVKMRLYLILLTESGV